MGKTKAKRVLKDESFTSKEVKKMLQTITKKQDQILKKLELKRTITIPLADLTLTSLPTLI